MNNKLTTKYQYRRKGLVIRQLWSILSLKRKRQFSFTLLLMILSSIVEVVSIGAVVPFLGVITNPEEVFNNQITVDIIQAYNLISITSPEHLILPVTIVFISAAIFAGIIRIGLLYVMTRMALYAGSDLSVDIYEQTLFQEYSVHQSRNSSEVINGIIKKTDTVISGILSPIMTLISSFLLFIGIFGALFFISPVVAMSLIIGLTVIYLSIISYTRSTLASNSDIIAKNTTLMIKSLQEGLGGIRDVIIDNSQEFYCELYRKADLPYRRAAGTNVIIGMSPRYILEAIGMSLIAIVAYLMTRQEDMTSAVPILGAFALSAQKLLPAVQRLYGSYSSIKGSIVSFDDVIKLMQQPCQKQQYKQKSTLPFKNKILLENISYQYSRDTPWILNNICLAIKKGDKIGFIGETGSGKSTLMDVIMGLLHPNKGSFIVDSHKIKDKNRQGWQSNISHVPQNIFLSDATIAENVAFGVSMESIDYALVIESLRKAQIFDVITSWKNGYQTIVGEGGIRLSGGQKQRIGIARALYKQSSVLILDEATSALDSLTEEKVMHAIDSLDENLTILIIAHRCTTLKGCDQIVRVEKNGTIKIGSYNDFCEIKY